MYGDCKFSCGLCLHFSCALYQYIISKTSRAFAEASAAGIGVPLVPTEGRDEPRKTAKYGKPTQMAQDVLFATNSTAYKSAAKRKEKNLLLKLGPVFCHHNVHSGKHGPGQGLGIFYRGKSRILGCFY